MCLRGDLCEDLPNYCCLPGGQRLQLLSPPEFSVERVMSSACGGRLCVYGARGATLVDLPARWGRAGLFDNGNQTVLCKLVY
ncbi:hypothetical protein RR46_11675 [Papilio xuthus]|uniref:Uncharacterized protein n=1 Tax=Papilio xuthus TaxID=66420 RepID=A0A194PRM4_PAPXU|nr:hypothetical protein RR46_11675 [Papilio xuthus]